MTIGTPATRIEARAKVTGRAVYTADVRPPKMVHATMVGSAIAAGRIRGIDTANAEAAPGVLVVITHRNIPHWHGTPDGVRFVEARFPLADQEIYHHDQIVAVVVANTREQAEYAAGLVAVDYEERPAVASLDDAVRHVPDWRFDAQFPTSFRFPPTGPKAEDRMDDSDVTVVSGDYRVPYHSHAPIEPNATVAEWQGDQLTVYGTSQGVHGDRKVIADAFGVPEGNVRVFSTLVGGAFGNKASVWPHTLLAVAAAGMVGRPVRLVATRKQVFTGHGHQPPIDQHLQLAALAGGKLQAIVHTSVNGTPILFDNIEGVISPTATVYLSPLLYLDIKVADMHMPTPTTLRTPADGPGMFAVGSAMDELSYALGIDPVQLRRDNPLPVNPADGMKPWSGKEQLAECYTVGAELFGWDRRAPAPRAMRDGDDWVGFGMSSAQRLEHHSAAEADVEVRDDGSAEVRTSLAEIGTGNLTTMVQIAADGTGVPLRRFAISSGDTALPPAPPTTGSRTTGSTGTAVYLAARAVRQDAITLAVGDPRSPLHGLPAERVGAADGRLFDTEHPSRSETYQGLLRRNGKRSFVGSGEHTPQHQNANFSYATYGAHFTEVRVNVNVPRVRVTRHVGVFAVGRVINPRTARNQAQGGIVFALGQTLTEQLVQDRVSGRLVTPSLTDYHIPVHADVGEIDVAFVEKPDYDAHPHGAKGLGEIVSVGVHASIANAVYHATGIRVRNLPITPDKLAGLVRESNQPQRTGW